MRPLLLIAAILVAGCDSKQRADISPQDLVDLLHSIEGLVTENRLLRSGLPYCEDDPNRAELWKTELDLCRNELQTAQKVCR